MNMISLKYYGDSGDKLQDYVTTTKHLVTLTMMVDNIVHPEY